MFLILLAFFGSGVHAAERTIYVEKATIWSATDPGFSYKDCVKPSSDAISGVCKRRQAWPVGGESVNVRPPLNRAGETAYAIIQIGDKIGWVNVADLDASHRKVLRNTQFFQDPNGKVPSPDLAKAGEKVTAFAPTSISRRGDTYFFVEYQGKDGKDYSGWMAGSAMTKTLKKDFPDTAAAPAPSPPAAAHPELPPAPSKTEAAAPTTTEPTKKKCVQCAREQLQQAEASVGKLNTAIRRSQLWMKDDADFEKFACIHSHAEIYDKQERITKTKSGTQRKMETVFSKDKFCSMYADAKPSFREQIRKASQAFGLPESVIGCTLMIESALYMNPKEGDEYRGYGQFGRAAVEDLKRYINNSEYRSMWKAYAPSRTSADFNSANLRDKPDVEMQVGAVAYYMKWLLTNRLPVTGCKDCGKDPNNPNRKDIYMAVAGYNWSPYGLAKLADLTPEQMKSGPPLKDETQSYLHKMDRCLEPSQHDKFVSESSSWTFKDRGAKCEQPCP